MSATPAIPIWKTAPFTRLLLPFIAGILLQWYLQVPLIAIMMAVICFSASFFLFLLLPLALRFKLQAAQGLLVQLVLLAIGLMVTYQKDIRHHADWYGNQMHAGDYLVIRIDEPLTEKTRSFKAEGYVESLIHNDTVIECKGKLFVYLSKDSMASTLRYGDRILIHKDLQPIKNSGNPGAFNYEQYAAFHQVFHNVFLKEKDWVVLEERHANSFKQFIFSAQEKILSVLRRHANTGKDELGIAEALLIGYTNDLDKDLVQAYSNTGVVHIIAISGMHLALIYLMLVWIFTRIPFVKYSKLLQVVLILSCLWLFSLLTGAAASVLRSAVMFSFISIGKNFVRQASIYNALAASAFVLLCYDPYFLWDVGFQLSYLALVGIIVFQKPIYNLFYIKSKWPNQVWQMAAVSLAAQILTFPVCIYYFHQFPTLFLLANIIVVPLSSLILYVEIFLLAFSWVPFVGAWLGKTTAWLVWLMNEVIIRINHLSFSVWDNIRATVFSTLLLYAFVISVTVWVMHIHTRSFLAATCCLLLFTMQSAWYTWWFQNQQKVIVYNVPQHRAIDFADGNNYTCIGDSILLEDATLQNFHLKPSRVALRLNNRVGSLTSLFQQPPFYQFNDKRIILINKTVSIEPLQKKIDVDLIVISGNPNLDIAELATIFNCKRFVFDASNSLWKIGKWRADCSALHLQCHSVPEEGAFVLNLAD